MVMNKNYKTYKDLKREEMLAIKPDWSDIVMISILLVSSGIVAYYGLYNHAITFEKNEILNIIKK